jgi:hypothetical protein
MQPIWSSARDLEEAFEFRRARTSMKPETDRGDD